MGQYESITTKDKEVLDKLWSKLVRKDLPSFGVVLYETMRKMADVTVLFNYDEEVFEEELEKHCRLVFVDLNSWMDAVNDSDRLTRMLRENAIAHAPLSIAADGYNMLRMCLLKAIRAKDTTHIFVEADYKTMDKVLRLAFDTLMEFSDLERKKLVQLAK